MTNWRRHIKNPTMPLRTGLIPKQDFATRPAPRLLGWRVDDSVSKNFVAAFQFGTKDMAEKERKEIAEWTKKNLEPRFGELKIIRKAQTLIAVRPDVKASSIETTEAGGPYIKSTLKQTRASDEPQTLFTEDLLSGKKYRQNPPGNVIITVPHAADDNIDDGHDTDWNSEKAARILSEELLKRGVDPILMIGEDNRDIWDLNRAWSNNRPFHLHLDENLQGADFLLDIHSYPQNYKNWAGYDVVLFDGGPMHDSESNKLTMDLAISITEQCPKVKVLIDRADATKNFIQNKGLIAGAESHLIEVVEEKEPKEVMEAVANYITGTKPNIPTQLPTGAVFQAVTIRLHLFKNEKPLPISMIELLQMELEELGFKWIKESYYANTDLISSQSYKLPAGFNQDVTLNFQRNQKSFLIYQAHLLTNEELEAIYQMVVEATKEQPLFNPQDADAEQTLFDAIKDMKIEGNENFPPKNAEIKKLVKLLLKGDKEAVNELNESKEYNLKDEELTLLFNYAASADSENQITSDSSEAELRATLEGKEIEIPLFKSGKFNKPKALYLAAGIITKQTQEPELKAELEKRSIKFPKKDDGKFDTKKAFELLTKGKQEGEVSLSDRAKPRQEKIQLSTRVTKMVIGDMFPGTHKIKEEKEGKQKGKQKGKQQSQEEDWSKIFKIINGNKISKREWRKKQGRNPNWDEWNDAPQANPPNCGCGQTPCVTYGETNPPTDWSRRKSAKETRCQEQHRKRTYFSYEEALQVLKHRESQGAKNLSVYKCPDRIITDQHGKDVLKTHWHITSRGKRETQYRRKIKEAKKRAKEMVEPEEPMSQRGKGRKKSKSEIEEIRARFDEERGKKGPIEISDEEYQRMLDGDRRNPPVTVDPKQGKFTMDITGNFVKDPIIVVTAKGEASQLNIGSIEEPPEGKLTRDMGRLVRVNMFRQKAGFKIENQTKQPKYIISVETGGKHYYAESEVAINGFAELKHFPEKRSEPRLRVETRGRVELYGDEKVINVRGRKHPLYERINIYNEKENPQARLPGMGEPFETQDELIERMRIAGWKFYTVPSWMKEKTVTDLGGIRVSEIFPDYMLEPSAIKVIEEKIEKRKKKKIKEAKERAKGTRRLDEYEENPSAFAQQYVKDHKLMTPKQEKKFEKFKLKGEVGSPEFFEQIAKKVQVFGEGQGWVRDGYLYWKKGPGHLNYVEVDGHMLDGGTAWMHTHPAAWEPSQTSPDDFKVMHGLFINHGVRDFFTIISDRIDWFRVKKKDRIPLEEMLEVVEDFENDIEREFAVAEEKFQKKMGDRTYLTSEQTRYITEHFNKVLPEFQMSYRAYALSPQQINGRSIPNPPPSLPLKGFFK